MSTKNMVRRKKAIATTAIILLVVGLLVGGLAGGILAQQLAPQKIVTQAVTVPEATNKAVELRVALRNLWTDHIVWTRMFIISYGYNDKQNIDLAVNKLMANQEAIGGAVGSVYGKDAGDKVTTLLKDHIKAAAEYVTATYAKDKAGQDTAVKKLLDNGNQIATLLSTANPKNWPKDAAFDLIKGHLLHTKASIDARAIGDFIGDAEAWKLITENAMQIADTLANGIIKQFPQLFAIPQRPE